MMMMLQAANSVAAASSTKVSPTSEQQTLASRRAHRESVLMLLDMHDEWDHMCPFFMFKYTQDGATGAWNSSAKEAAVSWHLKMKKSKICHNCP